ncbi:MAG TPA: SEC-C metal-binding domain-containing protein, partial [Solirubrobacteraceae bacterium]|nr:SEC-C metal-binding domain-containing protein [Solirubrobacteraceae bacterium]
REHLYEMDALRDGIGLRAVGQRDPLTEYQREAYDSFVSMMGVIRQEAVTYFFHVPITREDDAGSAGSNGAPAASDGPPAPAASPATNGPPAAASPTPPSQVTTTTAGNGAPAQTTTSSVKLPDLPQEQREQRLTYSDSAASTSPVGSKVAATAATSGDGPTVRQVQIGGQAKSEKVGRNDPCPCGSGQKYKRCHGA